MIIKLQLCGREINIHFFLHVQLGVRVQAGVNKAVNRFVQVVAVEVEVLEDEVQASGVSKESLYIFLWSAHLIRSAINTRHQVEAEIGIVVHIVVTVEQQQILLAKV